MALKNALNAEERSRIIDALELFALERLARHHSILGLTETMGPGPPGPDWSVSGCGLHFWKRFCCLAAGRRRCPQMWARMEPLRWELDFALDAMRAASLLGHLARGRGERQ